MEGLTFEVPPTSAFVLVFPPIEEDEPYKVLPFYWIPEENIDRRVLKDHVPYDLWREGLIQTTEGNVIHYAYIEKFIEESGGIYNIREIALIDGVQCRWYKT